MANTKQHDVFLKLDRIDIPDSQALFVGPFSSKEDAQAKIQEAIEQGKELIIGSEPPEHPERALKVDILAKINARREGLRSPEMGDSKNTLLPDIPNDFSVWNEMGLEAVKAEKRGRPRKEQIETIEQTEKSEKKEKREKPMQKINANTVELNRQTSHTERVVIISNKSGIIQWLAEQGIQGDVVPWISRPEQVENAVVIGLIPPHYAIRAKKYATIDVPNIPPGKKNIELTYDELKRYGARLRFYKTVEVE